MDVDQLDYFLQCPCPLGHFVFMQLHANLYYQIFECNSFTIWIHSTKPTLHKKLLSVVSICSSILFTISMSFLLKKSRNNQIVAAYNEEGNIKTKIAKEKVAMNAALLIAIILIPLTILVICSKNNFVLVVEFSVNPPKLKIKLEKKQAKQLKTKKKT